MSIKKIQDRVNSGVMCQEKGFSLGVVELKSPKSLRANRCSARDFLQGRQTGPQTSGRWPC